MELTQLHSIQEVSVQYTTGDLPVLVLCSDAHQYVCKYMRSNATISYKLACEFIGAVFAEAWKINTPPCAIVKIMPAHWASVATSHSTSAPTIGFCQLRQGKIKRYIIKYSSVIDGNQSAVFDVVQQVGIVVRAIFIGYPKIKKRNLQ